MSFVEFRFTAMFLPAVFLLYCGFHKHVKIQNFVLLCASVLFYACFGVKQLLFLFLCIMITFMGAVMGEKYNKKCILLALTANISLLVVMKYLPFFYANIDALSRWGGG